MATSVPAPMAMPTSAAASAGASLTPSPAMATTRPSPEALDDLGLVLRQHLGGHLGRCPASGRRPARWSRLSPVIMTMPDAIGQQASSASGVLA
jgi:hypothetical protein